MNTRYLLLSIDHDQLSRTISRFLYQKEHMEVSRLMSIDGDIHIHGRVRGSYARQWIGLDKRITIRLHRHEQHHTHVYVNRPVWKDKAMVLAVSLCGLWPLAVPALWGLLDQLLLLRHIRQFLAKQ